MLIIAKNNKILHKPSNTNESSVNDKRGFVGELARVGSASIT